MGLSFFAEKPVPDNLMGSIPTGDHGLIPVSSLSTFGFAGDYGGNLAAGILPQYSGLKALSGLNPFGDPLVDEDGKPLDFGHRVVAAVVAQGEAMVPLLGKEQQIFGGDDVVTGLKKQLPFTNASRYDAKLTEYLRDLGQGTFQVLSDPTSSPSSSSSSSSSSTPSSPWLAGSSSSSSSSTATSPWMK